MLRSRPPIYDCPAQLEGERLVQWIAKATGICIYGYWDAASWTLGFISILCWICAALPQVMLNFRLKSVRGVSLPFLALWALGDSANLAGSVLTEQLPFQILLAAYFVSIDGMLLWQYAYYEHEPPLVEVLDAQDGYVAPPASSGLKKILSMTSLVHVAQGAPLISHVASSHHSIGMVISYLCAALYVSSRLPQIYLNYHRKSVKGLSIYLFIAAFCGNAFYSGGILLSRQDLLVALPFLIGSAGTLIFDGCIFFQYWLYGQDEVDMVASFISEISERDPLLH